MKKLILITAIIIFIFILSGCTTLQGSQTYKIYEAGLADPVTSPEYKYVYKTIRQKGLFTCYFYSNNKYYVGDEIKIISIYVPK